jgi:hypothetical protein
MLSKINNFKKYKEPLFLFLIFILSFFIRRIGLHFGYPLLVHPDEATIIHPVYNMTVNKTFNPDVFNRPDQILYSLNFIFLNIVSYLKYGKSLAGTYLDNQLVFYAYARLLICFLGSLIPIVAFKIGKEFKINFSISAALIFAFFPSFVFHSHTITPDVPITLITLIIILFVIKYLNTGKNQYIYVAAVFSAINTAEKYPGLLSLAIVFMGILLQLTKDDTANWKKNIKTYLFLAVKTSGVYGLFLFLAAPNIFINYGKVIEVLKLESRSTHLGADNLSWLGNMLFYSKSFWSFSNILIVLFLFFGLVALIKIKERKALILLYGLFYWIVLSYLSLHWERWALPMYSTPLFITAIGLAYLFVLTKRKKFLYLLTTFIALIFFSHQFLYSLSSSISLAFTDTRVVALEFSQENGITAENSVYEGYTPFNPPYPGSIFDFNVEENTDKKYIFLSSKMYQRYFAEPERYKNAVEYYEKIRNNTVLIKEIKPTTVNHHNPLEALDNILFYLKRALQLHPPERYNGPIIQVYEIR